MTPRSVAPWVIILGSQGVMNVVDLAMVGRLGPTAQASAGLGAAAFWVVASAFLTLGAAVFLRVEEARDADPHEAGASLDSGLLLALLLALPAGYGVGLLLPALFPLVLDDADLIEGTSLYFQLRCMGLGLLVVNHCFAGFHRAADGLRALVVAVLLTHAANIAFNWVFIFGHFGVRPMGVRGAGMAAALAPAVGTVFYSAITAGRRTLMERFTPLRFRSLRPARLAAILRGARPEVATAVGLSSGLLAFCWLGSLLGTRELAAHSILCALASVGGLVAAGVGRSRDDGTPLGRALAVGLGLLVGPALLLLLAPDLLVGRLTPDGRVLQLARPAARVVGALVLIDVVARISEAALARRADPWATHARLGGFALVVAGGAGVLSFTDGALPAMWAIAGSTAAGVAAATWIRARRG